MGPTRRNPAGLFDNNSFPIGELNALLRSDLNGQLRLSAKQQAKCQEISTRSQSRLEELLPLLKSVNSVLPMKERDAKSAEFTRKMNAMAKEDREQINNLLTKEQAAMLRRIVVQQAFLHAIEMPGCFQIAADINPNSAGGLFDRIQATQQQREELRRLCEENVERARWRLHRELGEAVLKTLAPQQQEEYIDAIDTLPSASPGKHGRSDAKKAGEIPKTGGRGDRFQPCRVRRQEEARRAHDAEHAQGRRGFQQIEEAVGKTPRFSPTTYFVPILAAPLPKREGRRFTQSPQHGVGQHTWTGTCTVTTCGSQRVNV